MANELRDRITTAFQKTVANPVTRRLPTQTLLETTGRKSGQPRRTPLGGSRVGDQFWIVSEFGEKSQYVKNIKANPRVRVKIGRSWRSGTASILEDDDPLARLRWLKRPLNDSMLLAVGTQQLTIRVDLDREDL
jgi:deazaflavin-dependent oxidoreductase (nitroreductase family)